MFEEKDSVRWILRSTRIITLGFFAVCINGPQGGLVTGLHAAKFEEVNPVHYRTVSFAEDGNTVLPRPGGADLLRRD